jgi:hypothetical protein
MRIRDFDEESEDHPGDEAVAKRMTYTGPHEAVIKEALALKALGFTIIPVKTGSKDPSSQRWTEAATNDPAVFLRNPGTHNYGVLPPPGCFCWDVDGDIPAFLMETGLVLGTLPETRIHQSPHGQHWFFRWPEGYKRPTGPMFGRIVTRWPFGEKGQGYVVGPGSELVNGENLKYSVAWEADIAPLPYEWAQAAILHKPEVEREHKPLAERELIGEGERHDYLRDQARRIWGEFAISETRLFELVWDIYENTCVPYKPPLVARDEVLRAIGDVAQFPHDAPVLDFVPPTEETPTGPLFADLPSLKATLTESRLDPYLIDRFVVNNGLTIIAGHPKSMKSLGLLQAGFAFASRRAFLGMDALTECYPVFAYVTEEGSRYEMNERLTTLEDAYPDAAMRFVCAYLQEVRFDKKGYARVREGLLDIEERFSGVADIADLPLRVLMAFDPLRDFFPSGIKYSENDAQVMGMIKGWVRSLLNEFKWLSIVLVHHLRKASDGDTGLEMAGSGATYGAVDSTITWKRDKSLFDNRDDEDLNPIAERTIPATGKMLVETRGDATWGMRWNFNPASSLFQRELVTVPQKDQVLSLITLSGFAGISATVIADETGLGRDSVQARCRDLTRAGTIVTVGKGGRGHEVRYYLPGMEPPTLSVDDVDDIGVDPVHGL